MKMKIKVGTKGGMPKPPHDIRVLEKTKGAKSIKSQQPMAAARGHSPAKRGARGR